MKANRIVKGILERQAASGTLKRDDLRGIANYLPIMAFISEPDAPANWFNPEWLAFAGRNEQSMKNWAYQDFHHPAYLQAVVKGRFEATMAGRVWEDTFPLLGHDKKFHWLLSRAVPVFDEEGKVSYYFGFHLDVTNKVKTPHLKIVEPKKTYFTQFLLACAQAFMFL